MNFKLEIDPEKQVVMVEAGSLLNQQVRKEILLSVASNLRVYNVAKVLVDVRAATFNPDESMVNALDLISYMQSIGIEPTVKFAFIYSDGESHRKYFEKVAGSEGLNIRYFKEYDEAIAWLATS